jgi:hypothetical protein
VTCDRKTTGETGVITGAMVSVGTAIDETGAVEVIELGIPVMLVAGQVTPCLRRNVSDTTNKTMHESSMGLT